MNYLFDLPSELRDMIFRLSFRHTLIHINTPRSKAKSTVNGKNIYKWASHAIVKYNKHHHKYEVAEKIYFKFWYNITEYNDRITSNEYFMLNFRSPIHLRDCSRRALIQSCIDNGFTDFAKNMRKIRYIQMLMTI